MRKLTNILAIIFAVLFLSVPAVFSETVTLTPVDGGGGSGGGSGFNIADRIDQLKEATVAVNVSFYPTSPDMYYKYFWREKDENGKISLNFPGIPAGEYWVEMYGVDHDYNTTFTFNREVTVTADEITEEPAPEFIMVEGWGYYFGFDSGIPDNSDNYRVKVVADDDDELEVLFDGTAYAENGSLNFWAYLPITAINVRVMIEVEDHWYISTPYGLDLDGGIITLEENHFSEVPDYSDGTGKIIFVGEPKFCFRDTCYITEEEPKG
ncbi:hypothetical protein ACFLZC_00305 [Patescibacteria group bacterium]